MNSIGPTLRHIGKDGRECNAVLKSTSSYSLTKLVLKQTWLAATVGDLATNVWQSLYPMAIATALIHAIDCKGSRASMITNGPTTIDVFELFVDWLLLPALRPGEILIMDNLSSHKSSRIIDKIHSAGVEVLFLPPYSPDLNPIEQIFAKIKAILCRFGARTERRLYHAISKAIGSVTASDCLNCFSNSGYVAQ